MIRRLPVPHAVRHSFMKRAERVVTFTVEQIAAYAEPSGDHNPIHADADFARSVGLPGIIAHGMLQMSILGCVAVEVAAAAPTSEGFTAAFPGWSSQATP